MTARVPVSTPVGQARLWVDDAPAPVARLVLGHGAGGGPRAGPSARDLEALARELPGRGISVIRVEQPWRVAGRRVAPAPARLDAAWLATLEAVPRDLPLVVGGRSAGARVACRTAAATRAAGVVALAFPLHPPGRPERSRLAELLAAAESGPTLVVQGDRDAFGRPDEFPPGRYDVVPVSGADHVMAVPKAFSMPDTLRTVVDTVATWVMGEWMGKPAR